MGKAQQLMSSLQLCLAHYCDLHGPTPLMVTEGLPASCTVCFDDGAAPISTDGRPRSSAQPSGTSPQSTAALNEALRSLNLGRSSSAPVEQDSQSHAALLRSSSSGGVATPSGVDTPPRQSATGKNPGSPSRL
ncbi:hypothetical protein G7Z17_g4562 [Cylindrodendrum hubeiense]|uniref:Uncharacterized protein n=1 Tax=Cylindrodendrum hubeiense TaxID=595255 RepID=A0A9P5L9U9_9HYPO|nr:hypothetical protein G7Z17_g4562 [Cylindrodendrum hubeiense]